MIDLTKEQAFAKPVKCWVRNNNNLKWCPRWLIAVVDNNYIAIDWIDHGIEARLIDGFKYGQITWKECCLTDPNTPVKKVKKWETVIDVPPELWGRALVKRKNQLPWLADVMTPCDATNGEGVLLSEDLHYLPLGQPLDGEWLPFESEVIDD